jgi:hypothetical protein
VHIYSQFLPVSLIAAVVLEFDVQIERYIRSVHLVASLIGTGKVLLDFYGQTAVLLAVLHFVQLEVLVLEQLRGELGTSSLSTSLCSCAVLSDTSLMREKLSSFFR